MLNRRSIFGVGAAAVASVALPAVAVATERNDWDILIAGLAVAEPSFAELAAQARDQGFQTSEIYMFCCSKDKPFLLFRRKVDGVESPFVFDGHTSNGLAN